MSDNVNLSKKIVTYEAMSKYDEGLKQFINNKLANFDGGSIPTELTNQVNTNTSNINTLNTRVTTLENSNNSSLSFEENIPDGINSNGFINLGNSYEYEVDPNSSIVIRPKAQYDNNPTIYLNYPKIGQVNEYTIIINNDGVDHIETESGVLSGNIVLTTVDNNDRDMYDNDRFHWSTPPLYVFNESNKTYELNIKVVPYKEVFDEEYNRNTLLQYDAYVTWTEYTN